MQRPTRLVQTAIGDYRQAFLEIVGERLGEDFEVFAGDVYFDGLTKTRVSLGSRLHHLENQYLLGRTLLWQHGAVNAARGAGIAVLELNPRILSVWVSLIVRRVSGRPTLLWGHAWSRSGRASPTNRLRAAMWALADGVIVYTRQQAQELAAVTNPARIYVAPNALYRAEELQPAIGDRQTDFLFVGRLVRAKRPDLLVSAFKRALDRLPEDTRLVIVGEGELDEELREAAASVPEGRILFEGHVADPSRLRKLYARSIASVSPGFVGLSITQSLGYGVPMIIARNEPHSPEVEAAVEGWNSWFFAPTTADELAGALVRTAAHPTDPETRVAISAHCRERYSAEAMADGFLSALSRAAGSAA